MIRKLIKNLGWITILLILLLSPIIILLTLLNWIFIRPKDPHENCNKGQHEYEEIEESIHSYRKRCKNCGLLS